MLLLDYSRHLHGTFPLPLSSPAPRWPPLILTAPVYLLYQARLLSQPVTPGPQIGSYPHRKINIGPWYQPPRRSNLPIIKWHSHPNTFQIVYNPHHMYKNVSIINDCELSWGINHVNCTSTGLIYWHPLDSQWFNWQPLDSSWFKFNWQPLDSSWFNWQPLDSQWLVATGQQVISLTAIGYLVNWLIGSHWAHLHGKYHLAAR